MSLGAKKSIEEIQNQLSVFKGSDVDYESGKAFGLTFNPDKEPYELAQLAYSQFLSTNGLDFSQFPSLMYLEKEIVGFMVKHLNGGEDGCGTFTSGGTESIILALKSARDYSRKHKPEIKTPEVILPITAHAAHLKGCHYLGIKVVTIPVKEGDYRVDPAVVEAAISSNTIAIVGSAPSYTHGVIDPIEALGQLAIKHNIWLHVDACMGGFLLPYYKQLGKDIPPFDLSVEGVSSISADLHKYGYCPKGASVVLYNSKSKRQHQWFVGGDWLGYPLVNSTIQSSKSGGSLAAAWSVISYFGNEGYLKLTKEHIDAADKFVDGINQVEGVEVTTLPDFCILAFHTTEKSLFQVADLMNERGWLVQPVLGHGNYPACLHITISFKNFAKADQMLSDLKESVELANPIKEDPMIQQMIQMVQSVNVDEISDDFMEMLLQSFGVTGDALPSGGMATINEALNVLPPALRNKFLGYYSNSIF